MRKTKVILLLTIMYIVVNMLPELKGSSATKTDTEFERAVSYGFVSEALVKAKRSRAITWKEYCGVVYKTLANIDKEAANKWEKDAKRALKSNKKMKIYQGAFVIYRASEFVGENHVQTYRNYVGFANPFEVEIGNDREYNDFTEDTGEHDEWTYAETEFMNQPTIYRAAAWLYGFNRASYITYETLLPMDKLLGEPFSVEDAIRCAVRFYESREEFAEQYWLNRINKLEEQISMDSSEIGIDNIRKKILGSETQIVKSEKYIPGKTYTGTAYYVSNSGDDRNSGTSPEQAWQTLKRVEQEPLQPGDAVFFERGGIFRGALNKWSPENITYSAYGVGEKPVLTTSSENSAREECWKLYYEKDGVRIWKYYKDMFDCGTIIFDDNIAANKVLAKWSMEKKTWLDKKGKSFDVRKCLKEDLDFFSDDRDKYKSSDFSNGGKEVASSGPLYLRCDSGNPGKLYKDIELCALLENPIDENECYAEVLDVWENCVV